MTTTADFPMPTIAEYMTLAEAWHNESEYRNANYQLPFAECGSREADIQDAVRVLVALRKDGKPQTLRFAVPRLDPGITPGELLLAGQAGGISLPALADRQPDGRARMTPAPQIEGPALTIAEQSAPPPQRPARRNAAPEIPASGRQRNVTEGAQSARPGKVAGDDGYWRARAFAEAAERGIDDDRLRKLAAMQVDRPVEGFSMSSLDESAWETVHRLILGFPVVGPETDIVDDAPALTVLSAAAFKRLREQADVPVSVVAVVARELFPGAKGLNELSDADRATLWLAIEARQGAA